MNQFESLEDYLERILMLSEENKPVRSIDIALSMGFSKPSVSIAMKKLKERGLIEINDKGHITLTGEGHCIASTTYEKHKLITDVLIAIGVSEEVAREDACKIEHEISDETFVRLKAYKDRLK